MIEPIKLTHAEVGNRINSDIKEYFRVFPDHWQNDYKDSYFLWYEGNLTLDKFDLESDNYDDDFVGYVINGDLNTSKILNYETDYGVHLIVLGNLSTNYIAVGGQDIYIDKDLNVSTLFVGSYNHGTINIKNNFTCPLIVIDDYHCTVKGELNGKVFGWGNTVYLERNGDYIPAPHENELEDDFDDYFLNSYDGINFSVLVKAIDDDEEVPKKYVLNIENDMISSQKVRLISESDFLKIDRNVKKHKIDGDYYFASHNGDIEELVIEETYQSHKYVICDNKVQVFYKENSNENEFQEYIIGSNRYRKATRLINEKIERMQYWR
jgi:hypothetical protein